MEILQSFYTFRLTSQESVKSATEIKEFSEWILKIGDGNMNLNKIGKA